MRAGFSVIRACCLLACLGLGTSCAQAVAPEKDLDCWYVPLATKEKPTPELEHFAACASVDRNGAIHVRQEHLRALDYDASGLGSIQIADQFFYVERSGRMAAVLTYDNGADSFAEGMARTRVDGKIGFFDTKLDVVIPARYDWAWPFRGGRAMVCDGCRPGDPENQEHTPMVGGKWGFIDPKGREVVPVRLSKEEALAMAPPG